MVYICQLLAHLLHQSKVITHHREDTDNTDILEVSVEGFKYQGSLTDENESTKIIHFYTIH